LRLTEELKKSSINIWEKIYRHPFVVELYRGVLPIDKFKFYVIQDYNFLIGMTKAFSLVAAKSRDYELIREALTLAYGDVTIEMENYIKLLDKLGLKLEDIIKTEPSPTNYAYVNHVLVTCSLGSPLECLVSTLPCFWTYLEIAEHNKGLVKENKNKIYLDWINTYLSKEYRELTMKLIDIVDRMWKNEEIDVLKRIFIISSRYEYLFWDMAYNLENWMIK